MRVTAAGLNPMDWIMTADAGTAARFGLTLPAGFGTDYAGTVDQVGGGVTGFAPGMRVFGSALSRAVADYVVVDAALAAGRVTAAIDLHGTETVDAARELGVPDGRICTIAAQVDGVTPANGANAAPGALEEVARLIAAGQLRVPIAASFPVEQIRTAVEFQASRHAHGKVVIDL